MRLTALLFAGLACAQAQSLPSIYVIGDSTANNANHRGWADPFGDYFNARKIQVVNRARAGRSSRTFLTEGLWERVRADLKPGDTVLIQFGHNDGGPPDKDRARGSLPGLGDESQEFTLPDGRHEVVHTFGWYMRKFIAETKAAGATPIVLSPTVRNIWTDGKVERGPGHFGEWSAEIARAEGVRFLDVTTVIADRYEQLGPDRVKELFPEDHTHTSPAGADLTAALIAGMLPELPHNPRYPLPADPKLPALFLIGDSTVRNGNGDGSNGQWGWGEPLVDLFDASKISVVNRAVGGLSSRTYLTGGWWQHVLEVIKPGDFVMMQFGHNDNGPLDDTARARGTLKGTGEETQEVDNPITKQHETVHTYGWYLRRFIADARAKGATPIMCTLIPRKIWKDGKIARDDASYAGWAREVAAAENVPAVDLNERIAARYDELGPEKVEPLFGDPHTHTSRAGAELNAAIVVEGLKSLKDDPLASFLK
ncbi:MAG TPA: rhamnogalacturonan acetylesterase [Bryobacteraceae bacterium]